MDAIASGYADTKDEWTAMDMAVYSTLDGKTAALTDTAKQNVLNLLIKDANNQKDNLSDHSRIEIVLRSLGIDSTRLYSVNSSTPTDNAKILSAADYSTLSYYTAPYILLANLQGNVKLSAAQVNTLIGILKANMGSGLFESVYKASPTPVRTPRALPWPLLQSITAPARMRKQWWIPSSPRFPPPWMQTAPSAVQTPTPWS